MTENEQLDKLWGQILEKAQATINPVSYQNFIKPLKPMDISNKCLILESSSNLAANTVTNKFASELTDSIKQCGNGLSSFRLYVKDSKIYTLDKTDDDEDFFTSVPLNKNFTFSSFVVGSSNKFVYAAAKSVAEHPGENFNPLFIYGESGLGKTHLLHAIANQLALESPNINVLYTTCENFLNEFIDAMARGNFSTRDKGAKFRQHYRNVDILMIDDIQFLAKKPGVQEEFFHTFNELTGQNKQIVLTSDRPPKEIATLEERLRTRFEGGLIADIQPPDMITKIAILKRKALEKKCPMPEDVLEYLASDSGHDVRTLEGRLNKVIFASKFHEEPISLELAKKALEESVPSSSQEQEEATPETIISATCSYYKFKKEELLGKSKKAELAKARQICAYLMCDILQIPLDSIGEKLGGKDHTTIIYSRNKIEGLIRLNERIAKEVDDIRNIVFKK